ncbi:MAG: hypothetical protein VX522_07560 [Actinomycetota bacterium]|nr:hypothetical protein [Actinomycetota bacterium]
MKKGRHRRYEEARALKQNQDLDLDAIFDSLDVADRSERQSDDGASPEFDAWADDYESEDEETVDEYEETAESA